MCERSEHHKNKGLGPLTGLLKQGITPTRLAWSLALGAHLGVIPMLGVTTLLCTIVALPLRLNLVAIQAANWLVYPLQFVLLIPFFKAGAWLFRSGGFTLSPDEVLRMIQEDPWGSVHSLWESTWQAVVAWALAGLIMVPLMQLGLRYTLSTIARKRERSASGAEVLTP